MTNPDTGLIIETSLYSQGFVNAASLARKLVNFFKLASEQLSLQKHYDFGLRAIKVASISLHISSIRIFPFTLGMPCLYATSLSILFFSS